LVTHPPKCIANDGHPIPWNQGFQFQVGAAISRASFAWPEALAGRDHTSNARPCPKPHPITRKRNDAQNHWPIEPPGPASSGSSGLSCRFEGHSLHLKEAGVGKHFRVPNPHYEFDLFPGSVY
jgi:hypothetical protein